MQGREKGSGAKYAIYFRYNFTSTKHFKTRNWTNCRYFSNQLVLLNNFWTPTSHFPLHQAWDSACYFYFYARYLFIWIKILINY